MNNKGFTLIELIVTIVILAIVMSFGAYSIISIINATKEQNYQTLVKNIKSAVESYAIECKYSKTDNIDCTDKQITLGELVKYGYLSGNSKDDTTKEYTLINPKDNKSISNCIVKYAENSKGKITVTAVTTTGSCPKPY